MAKSTRRARLILVGLAIALVVVAVPLAGPVWEPVWEWVIVKEYESFHANGLPKSFATSRRWGKKHAVGTHLKWYESGQKESEESFDEDGRPHGLWVCWNKDGQVTKQVMFRHGRGKVRRIESVKEGYQTWFTPEELAEFHDEE